MHVNGFLLLDTWNYKAFYYYNEWLLLPLYDKRPPLAILWCTFAVYNILRTPSCLLGIINYHFYLLIHIHSNSSLLILPILSMQSVKNIIYSWCTEKYSTQDGILWNSTLLCLMLYLLLDPTAILYFPYITHNGALTYAYK